MHRCTHKNHMRLGQTIAFNSTIALSLAPGPSGVDCSLTLTVVNQQTAKSALSVKLRAPSFRVRFAELA